jgi:hypothetical protein
MPDAGHARVPDDFSHAAVAPQTSLDRMTKRRPLLLLLEGANDADFLLRISRLLNQAQASPVNLADLANQGQVVIVPFGGGISAGWWNRFAPLGCPEFHLLDREQEPQTSQRKQLVERVKSRPGCDARITSKRSLENYLHPAAIFRAGGGEVRFGDDDCVAQLLVCGRLEATHPGVSWESLSPRTRQRLKYRGKRWLNTKAVEHMTAELLAQRDPAGEVLEWLSTIAAILEA